MINSAVGRLTIAYLTILMILSIGFSYLLYNISSNEFSQGFGNPKSYELSEPNAFLNFNNFKDMRLSEAQRQLINSLLLLNLGTLVLGSLLSYGLAKHNVRPIEEALEAQSRFTADASHELRTPLTALQTEIEVSLRDKKLNLKEAKDQLSSNLEEVIKLRSLSDRLLRLAREDKDITLRKTSYKSVASKAVGKVKPLANNKRIKIDTKFKDMSVIADQQKLEDSLVVLLDNAIKYSPNKTTITITTKRSGRFGQISVIDQGQGIKKSDLPHIFERFYRADHARSKEQTSGYGLGLSIALKLIEAQKGSLDAQSKINKGSTFNIKLPLS